MRIGLQLLVEPVTRTGNLLNFAGRAITKNAGD